MLTSMLFALCCAPQPLALQDEGRVHPPSPVEVFKQQSSGGGQEEDEMVVLFGRVERRLRAIDRMLFDASAGRHIEAQAESGIEDLLQRTRSSNQEVLEGIDAILDLAHQRKQKQQQGSGSGEQSQPGEKGQSGGQPGDSPLDQQSRGQSPRESTPEGPGGERPESGAQPDQQPGEQPGQDPQAQPGEGQRPEGNQDSNAEPGQKPGSSPPDSTAGSGSGAAGDARWGDLPVHVRELFRAQGGADMPPHYRDWIDAYYRRLNRVP